MNNLLKIWAENKPVINSWLSIPNSFTAEAFGKMGWDAITIDMQHGQTDYSASISMLQALSSSSSTPMVRVPTICRRWWASTSTVVAARL